MTQEQMNYLFKLLKSIDNSLKELVKRKAPKRNKHKPPGPTYMDK